MIFTPLRLLCLLSFLLLFFLSSFFSFFHVLFLNIGGDLFRILTFQVELLSVQISVGIGGFVCLYLPNALFVQFVCFLSISITQIIFPLTFDKLRRE